MAPDRRLRRVSYRPDQVLSYSAVPQCSPSNRGVTATDAEEPGSGAAAASPILGSPGPRRSSRDACQDLLRNVFVRNHDMVRVVDERRGAQREPARFTRTVAGIPVIERRQVAPHDALDALPCRTRVRVGIRRPADVDVVRPDAGGRLVHVIRGGEFPPAPVDRQYFAARPQNRNIGRQGVQNGRLECQL